jgi:hypothetical protein
MRKRVGLILLLLALTAVVASAGTVVLNFDDIDPSGVVVQMPVGYGGLTWDSNIGVYGWDQPPYNPQSPPNRVLFDLDEENVTESHASFIGGPQVFDGAYFAGDGTAEFNLYRGGTLVWTSSVLSLSGTPTFLSSGYAGLVDTVGIVAPNDGAFVMDDFTFQTSPTGAPEPSTFALVVAGILAACMGGRRKSLNRS